MDWEGLLGTLGDALRPILFCGIDEGIFLTHLGIRFRKEPGRSRTIGYGPSTWEVGR